LAAVKYAANRANWRISPARRAGDTGYPRLRDRIFVLQREH
jgi:hypothetical protein